MQFRRTGPGSIADPYPRSGEIGSLVGVILTRGKNLNSLPCCCRQFIPVEILELPDELQ